MKLTAAVVRIITHALALVVGLAIGSVFGVRQEMIRGLHRVQSEVAESLAHDVEVASSLRIGKVDRGLALLDRRVDTAVLSLASSNQNVGYVAAQASWTTADSLSWARLYRSAVPSTGQDAAAVQSALSGAPSVPTEHPIGPSLSSLARGSN